MSTAAELAPEHSCLIDFEVDSEWNKCIYSDCSRSGPQCSRNNSSNTVFQGEDDFVPMPEPDFLHKCAKATRQCFEATNLRRAADSVILRLCVRKHNYENYLWQFVRQGRFIGTEAYANLSLWTMHLRVRMHCRVPFGCLLRGLRCRLGLGSTTESLKLCLDGFYGMPGFGDIFGNHGDDTVPWMEISNQSTADSLRLRDGDIIFVSYSNEKLESLARARKHALMSHSAAATDTRLAHAKASGSTASESLMVDGNEPNPISHNALPQEDLAPTLPLYTAESFPMPRPQQATLLTAHPGQPRYIAAAATSADSQFCQAIVNTSDPELGSDGETAGVMLEIFARDDSGLLPNALKLLHQAHSEMGDLVRVCHPNSKSQERLDLVLSPELMTWVLDAANNRRTPRVHPLLAEARATVFKCDSSADVDAADGIGVGAGAGRGVVEELQRFARELDSRFRVRCTGDGSGGGGGGGGGGIDIWSPDSVAYFVVDTFFAASISSIYGIERNHRFHPYAVDSALLVIEEGLVGSFSHPAGLDKVHNGKLDRAWENIYGLHPTSQELAAAEPCRHFRELLDRFLKQRSKPWKSFVGCSLSCLYSDYSAKKAAFWAISYLVSDAAVYETLLAEIDAMTPETGPQEFRKLTLNELEEMPFLEAFVKEVYRHTTGQFVSFKACSDLLLQTQQDSAGISLRSGGEAGVLLRALNMDPSQFSNPELFLPQRFMSGSQSAELLALPLGCLWPRRRLGLLKLKLFLVLLLSRCRIRAGEGPTAQVDSSAFCVDVLPWTEDTTFQFRARDRSSTTLTLT